jgi:general secretion pathway protein F
MVAVRYRALAAGGEIRTGTVEAADRADAVDRLRRRGLTPIETTESADKPERETGGTAGPADRQAMINAVNELSVLLGAGLSLDRALAVVTENAVRPKAKVVLGRMHGRIKEGAPLSRALGEAGGLLPPMAAAMAEAGEADGRLDVALKRLADALDRTEALRRTITSAMVYPALLSVLAVAVILLMMLFVVPQFETFFTGQEGRLPLATQLVVGASRAVRGYGFIGLAVLIGAGFLLQRWAQGPAARRRLDRWLLTAPLVGGLTTSAQTARFARVLGSLVSGGVPLPAALGIAQRSIGNTHMAEAVGRVAAGLKRGAGLSAPLAATGVIPPMALSFIRTGEETAQLGPMLDRLADVLDRDVRTAVERLIAILTPTVTIVMGAVIATVIASIMSAILGFNDLAIQ